MIPTYTVSFNGGPPSDIDHLDFTFGRKLVVTFLLQLTQEALEKNDLALVQRYLTEVRNALDWGLSDAIPENWQWNVRGVAGNVLASLSRQAPRDDAP